MNRRNILLGAFAALGLGSWYMTSNKSSTTVAFPDAPLPGAANAQGTNADIDTSGIQDMVMGSPDAPVEIIEYASFTCPHCATFHQTVFKQLKADYIDTGKVRFVYREVFFDRFGLWASLMARCGGEAKYFGIVDLLYGDQSKWTRAGDPAAIVEELRKIGRLSGQDTETLEACLQDGEQAQAMVAWYQKNAEADGIDSTPSFVIDGKKQPNMNYNDMKKIIDDALAG
ncbi:DsbA family protein [Sulfitobacter donghicola]|uniref:Thiol-disulfide oxidoreductase n=1 Tax=Sulfitobacter donghicola DSW-25 = KCTC 12864 = JCM 14565 TaxID=1300350 RepID=A0A073ILS2_9RHOB|nr:DsbA family protein [Sulfitobacter donghicola]KEJ90446.1 thiol-disulfide oxidoreductase [Sulfitobacter donghicola DSW-25 = KCTC 12864 = JCM 14565]KIN67678.1 Thiol:disulfide interchange protein, DsbA family [Sulfitobacter donghicola DSW-25 = KCTC 12864 = JCM 14565]